MSEHGATEITLAHTFDIGTRVRVVEPPSLTFRGRQFGGRGGSVGTRATISAAFRAESWVRDDLPASAVPVLYRLAETDGTPITGNFLAEQLVADE